MLRASLSLTAIILVLASCTIDPRTVTVLEGNYRYVLGQYQDAMVEYLKVADQAQDGAEAALYNLANVYYVLGEQDQAIDLWTRALETSDQDLSFRILFHLGLVYFDKRDYARSQDHFTRALLIRPQDMDVRRNLERAYRSNIRRDDGVTAGQGTEAAGAIPASLERLLEYVKRKEVRPWQYRSYPTVEEPETNW